MLTLYFSGTGNTKYIAEKFAENMQADCARVLTDLLTETQTEIIYAEHINMPNNICNFFLLPLAKAERINKYVKRADIKLAKVTHNINSGIIKKRGFNPFSKLLGLLAQRLYFQKIEQKTKQDVRINSNCNQCGICTRICPTNNLKLVNNKIEQKGQCTLCYRCVNACPKQAITVFLHSRVKHQYKGPI